jgi:hypothetical protein
MPSSTTTSAFRKAGSWLSYLYNRREAMVEEHEHEHEGESDEEAAAEA